jgi:hypothetical protein
MANHTNIRVFPWIPSDISNMEMANDVLLHDWAQMAKVTLIWPTRKRSLRFSRGIFHECLPYPSLIATSVVIPLASSASCEC